MPRAVRAWAPPARLAAALLAAAAFAALPSTAAAECTISATGVNFGTYDVYAPLHTDSTGTITYRCHQRDYPVEVMLSPGGSGIFAPRRMDRAGGGDRLDYNLYQDATRTTIWGDGTNGTSAYLRTDRTNQTVTITVYGRIPASQDVSVGAYTDTVIVTIAF